MRVHVELEDGKAETVFIPAAAIRDAQNLDLDGQDFAIYVAWWAFDRRGLLPDDVESWEDFAYVAHIKPVEATDPKA